MRTIVALAVAFLLILPALASILHMDRIDIVFAKEKRTPGVTLSESLKLTDAGLVVSKEGWLQTDKMPAGLAWRPPASTRVTLSVADLPDARAYVRHGCDGAHWSAWQLMQPGKPCDVSVSKAARQNWSSLAPRWGVGHDVARVVAAGGDAGKLPASGTRPEQGGRTHTVWRATGYGHRVRANSQNTRGDGSRSGG
jgi:hypothetical protein